MKIRSDEKYVNLTKNIGTLSNIQALNENESVEHSGNEWICDDILLLAERTASKKKEASICCELAVSGITAELFFRVTKEHNLFVFCRIVYEIISMEKR